MDEIDGCTIREIDLDDVGLQLKVKEFTLLQDEAGAVIWDAGLVLAHYLAHLHAQGRCLVSGRTCLELGSGTGVVGLTAARLGAAHVHLTDLPHLVPYVRENIQLNGLGATCSAEPLDWANPDHLRAVAGATTPAAGAAAAVSGPATTTPTATGATLLLRRPPDVVLASDVVYTPATRQAFFAALSAALGPPLGPPPPTPPQPPPLTTPPLTPTPTPAVAAAAAASPGVVSEASGQGPCSSNGQAAAGGCGGSAGQRDEEGAGGCAGGLGGSGAAGSGPLAILCFEQRPGVEELPGLFDKHGLQAREVPSLELHPDWRCDEIHLLVVRRRPAA